MTMAQYDNRWADLLLRSTRPVLSMATPFYRRYPYQGPLWWSEVDMRVAVSLDHSFLYNRLPKCANSTVTAMLFELASGQEASARHAKHGFRRPSRLKRAEVGRLDDLFKFCVVRDPYGRTLSAYLDKIARPSPQARRPLRWLKRRFDANRPNFEQFCVYLDEVGLFDDNHWAPQTAGLVLPIERFDHVARFENIGAEIQYLSQRIFGRAWAGTEARGPEPTGADKKQGAHYTGKAREIVARLFKDDFTKLGYPR